jgi:hypothetical protein
MIMNDELGRTWKEAFESFLKYHFRIGLKGVRKTLKISGRMVRTTEMQV